MSAFIGIDTSNYTTSVSLYNRENSEMKSFKRLLPVKSGEKGLRQSDAVFSHSKALPDLLEQALETNIDNIRAIGVSDKPRCIEGSYMPCFTVGEGYAKVLAHTLGIPLYRFSHQQGHIAAAVYSVGNYNLLFEPFIAFHISGGTTEALLYTPNKNNLSDLQLEIIGKTLDLNAGQLIDRTGVMIGLDFPCGSELETLAQKGIITDKPRAVLKDCNISLSGFQNKAEYMFKKDANKEDIALFIIEAVKVSLEKLIEKLLMIYGDLPLLFAGGVMSNRYIKNYFTDKFGALFAEPSYSSDNASGISFLTSVKTEGL